MPALSRTQLLFSAATAIAAIAPRVAPTPNPAEHFPCNRRVLRV
jgi:hypothetical protein